VKANEEYKHIYKPRITCASKSLSSSFAFNYYKLLKRKDSEGVIVCRLPAFLSSFLLPEASSNTRYKPLEGELRCRK